MSREDGHPTSDRAKKSNLAENKRSSGVSYSLLGIGAALSLHENEDEVSNFIASAVTEALEVKLGAVALLNGEVQKLRVFGQFGTAKLPNALGKEIENFLSRSRKISKSWSIENFHEVEVNSKSFAKLCSKGLCRLLMIRLRTLDQDFGVALAGKSSDEPFSLDQKSALETLASQLSIALHRIRLNREREANESALRQSEERYRKLYNETPVMMHSIDHEGRLVSVNDYWLEVLGFERKDVIGRKSVEFLTEASRRYALEVTLPEFMKTGFARDVEYELVKKNGEVLDALLSAVAERDEAGQIIYTLAFIVDVTERRRAEEALRQSEERYRKLYNETPVMLHSIDHEGRLVSVNDHWLKVLGYERGEVIGRKGNEFLTEESRRYFYEVSFPEYLKTGIARDVEYQMVKKDGEVIDVLLNASAEKGKIQNSLAFIVDVTERKQAQEALRKSEERFHKIFDYSNDAIFVIDTEHDEILDCNSKACNMLGYCEEELLAMPISAIHPKEVHALRAFGQSVFEQGSGWTDQLTCLTKSGNTLPAEISASAIDIAGRTCMIALVRDITERKQAETELKKYAEELAQSNADLESFSYSVSHDLRTPLRAIDGFSRILLEDYSDKLDSECNRLLNIIRDNTHNMGQLIDNLLLFSRLGRTEMQFTEINLQELVKTVFNELKTTTEERNINLNIKKLPGVSGDRSMIRQVFVNLISNAVKFTEPKPTAIIEIGAQKKDDGFICYVKDNGVGFDMQYIDKLFGVFQRLHSAEEFEGTGVGLAIVQRIVQRHGGRVWADGEVNKGATISFMLPKKGGRKS